MQEQKPLPMPEISLTQGSLFAPEELARLTTTQQQWEEQTVQQSLRRLPERENLETTSGVPVERVYTPLDNRRLDYQRDLGLPGTYPYTRGVQPTMYRAKPWTMRMFAGRPRSR